ncbi:MAG TPA: hypothetical protein VF743_09860, partial [Acidimicrobiales bacterium]
QLAAVLAAHYGDPELRNAEGAALYRVRVGDQALTTSVLTRPDWLDVAVPLGGGAERVRYQPPPPTELEPAPRLDGPAVDAALRRLAEVEVSGTVMINNPLYRLLDVDVAPGRLDATVTLVDFAEHALTTELMEGELLDALTAPATVGRPDLPLRDAYLPTAGAALALAGRTCVGGAAAVLAIARATGHGGRRDYVVLAQERSAAVLNAAGTLAVIPKAFHQPTGEPADEARVSTTLRR